MPHRRHARPHILRSTHRVRRQAHPRIVPSRLRLRYIRALRPRSPLYTRYPQRSRHPRRSRPQSRYRRARAPRCPGCAFQAERSARLFFSYFSMLKLSSYQSNSASTNSSLLNSCISSIFSPTPMNLTGMSSSFLIEMTMPPFAVPSSLLSTSPVIFAAFLNSLA